MTTTKRSGFRAGLFLSVVACGAGGAAVGISEPKGPSPSDRDASQEVELVEGRLEGFEIVAPRATSRGHFLGTTSVEVRANALARSGLESGAAFREGSRFLALHAALADGGRPLLYAASKEASDGGTAWAFAVRGDRGSAYRCLECHREAEHDFVFTRLDSGARVGSDGGR